MCKGLIELSSTERSAASAKWLMEVSQQLIRKEWPVERSVDFDGSAFPMDVVDAAAEVFLSSVERNGEVRRLRMGDVSLDAKLSASFWRALRSNASLSSLELRHVRFADDAGGSPPPSSREEDVPAMMMMPAMEALSIARCCGIPRELAASICECVRSGRIRDLRLLDLRMGGLDDGVSSRELSAAIAGGSLSNLEMRDVPMGASAVAGMLRGLARNANLKTLRLDHCGINDEHVPALSDMLSFSSTQLESLSLSMNDLNGECIRKIANRGLPHNRALKNLDLSYNPIGDDGARHLGELLVSNTTLESLSMIECDVWDDGCTQFISKLPQMRGLKQLIVDSEWESHDTLLLEAMQRNYTLRHIWTQRSAWLMKHDPAWRKVGFLLRLNAAKRRILVERNAPPSVLPEVLTSADASSIFYLLTHQPSAIR